MGLEDNIWFDAGRTVPATNPMLVERIVNVARSVGREIASPRETRELLGLDQAPGTVARAAL